MNGKQLLSDLRGALEGIKNSNQSSIQIDALSQYLDKWEAAAENTVKETDAARAQRLDEWKTQLAVSSAEWLEMFKAVIEAGMTALKSSIVINGGAAATLLALLADGLRANGSGHLGLMLTPLGWAWMCFMCGLGCAGTATGTRYISQALYAEAFHLKESRSDAFFRRGNWARNTSAFLGFCSFLLFFIGSGLIFSVLISSAPVAPK
ncbi:hypothetical protein [Hydrogenophaga sp.]|uniref:hypothetical protein n=1 Tax=Hydrogenophaga sp. TaxID=1904254 RepID=UPI00272F38BD|nr:hypothetical protein [Hydrogenophaga sp.]MDP1684315.1 hypothetical protein [Hydrogenophaga sp.]